MLFWVIFYPPPLVRLFFYASFDIVGHADTPPPPPPPLPPLRQDVIYGWPQTAPKQSVHHPSAWLTLAPLPPKTVRQSVAVCIIILSSYPPPPTIMWSPSPRN